MLKKILMLIAMLYAAASFAAVDVNKATAAELDSIKGIGPVVSSKIIDARKSGAFKDWNDFIGRVNGIGEKSAAGFSADGLTVNGSSYSGAPAKATKPTKDKKGVDKKADNAADAKAASTAPANVATPAASGTVKK